VRRAGRLGAVVSPKSTTRVLVAGGGVAALEAALAMRALAEDRVSVELLAPEPQFWYRPLAVAEPFSLGALRHFDLSELAAAAGATFSPGELVAVDAPQRVAHARPGGEISYDALLVACGAVPIPAVEGALTFRGPADTDELSRLLDELSAGRVRRLAFVVPRGAVWSLPAYELALLTAAFVAAKGLRDVRVALVTPENEPLQLFGRPAVEAVGALLDARGIDVHTAAHALEFAHSELRLSPEGAVEADRVVALPRLGGPRIYGVPQTVEGFVPVDRYGRVSGLDDVFAAGDITTFPVKQGGIAAQQADAAAATIAALAGADVVPQPFQPVLRGLLLTGGRPRYLRHDITDEYDPVSAADTEPLWWPPAKIVGRHLAPFLGARVGLDAPRQAPPPGGAVMVDVEIDEAMVAQLSAKRLALAETGDGNERTVGDEMSTDPLVVAPEDTLGEVADRMEARDVGSAVVVDYGRLIGILTTRDLLRAFGQRVHPSDARVREWMTADPVTVLPETTLEAAVALMTEYGVHHLPVLDGPRVAGILGYGRALAHQSHS
jgi:sulfide:quinone oxidoreductase